MGTSLKQKNLRQRKQLGRLRRLVEEWQRALRRPPHRDCPHRPGDLTAPALTSDAPCPAAKRCRVLTFIAVRVQAANVGMDPVHLTDAQLPGWVDALVELFSHLPVTCDWLAFARALQEIHRTGGRPAAADSLYPPTGTGLTTQPKEHHA